MKIIGLCGGSGSGKGTVAELFSLYGIPSVDTDKVYRQLTNGSSPCLDALVEEFGDGILSPQGSLDRAKLRCAVFDGDNAEKKRKRLNEITHKFILDRAREMLRSYEKEGKDIAIVDAPLLFESGFNKECDLVISVLADKELRILRIVRRDGLSREAARARIESQLSDEELELRSDHTIINNGDIQELRDRVAVIVEELINKK